MVCWVQIPIAELGSPEAWVSRASRVSRLGKADVSLDWGAKGGRLKEFTVTAAGACRTPAESTRQTLSFVRVGLNGLLTSSAETTYPEAELVITSTGTGVEVWVPSPLVRGPLWTTAGAAGQVVIGPGAGLGMVKTDEPSQFRLTSLNSLTPTIR